MHSPAYSSYGAATLVAHCFSPSDLMPLVRAHAQRLGDKGILSAGNGLGGTRSETSFQGLLFYLSSDDGQAAHQLGAISGLMQEIHLRSLPWTVRGTGGLSL